MTKEIKETIEGLKKLDKANVFVEHIKAHFKYTHPEWNVKCKICNRDIDEIYKKDECSFGSESISIAIGWGETIEQAEGELKKNTYKTSVPLYFEGKKRGFDQAIDIARPILAKAKLRIRELHSACGIKDASIETSIKMYRNLEKEFQSAKLRIEELEKKISGFRQLRGCEDSVKIKQKYQSLKEKLTVPNMIVTLSKIVPHLKYFSGTEQQCEAQALIEELTGGKNASR